MDRRKFLKKSSTGALAAAFLPLLSFTQKAPYSNDNYEINTLYEKEGKKWLINIILNPELLSQFKDMNAENKVITIDAYDTSLITMHYEAQSVAEKTIDSKNLHFINLKLKKNKMNAEAITTAEEVMGKEIIIEIHNKCHAVLRNKKKDLELKFKYKGDASDADCFLTTACVLHKNLPDNCYELNTLRTLREKVMIPNRKYNGLIEEYQIIAPKMLLNINRACNKDEVLDHIYAHLVLPSVALVEAGKNKEAIEHYTDFVKEMKNRYL